MDEQLERRVTALERALTDGEGDAEALAEGAAAAERITDLEERIAAVEDSVTELDAATQALRGYVGNVRAVNEEVKQQADLALSKVESLETDSNSATGDTGEAREADRCGRCGHALPEDGREPEGQAASTDRMPAGAGRTTAGAGGDGRREDSSIGTKRSTAGDPKPGAGGRTDAVAEAQTPGGDPFAGAPDGLGAATAAENGGDGQQVSADGGEGGPIDRLRRLL